MAMNLLHRWCCRSRPWAAYSGTRLLPWTLDNVDLGERTLDIGPGYGANMQPLLARAGQLTVVEIDGANAERLAGRFGERARVIEADATDAGLPTAEFSSIVCFTMLHHVPTPDAQDRMFAEIWRMLEPGGIFAGSDGRHSVPFELVHIGDTYCPVSPDDLPDRLRAAGFDDVDVSVSPINQRWCARKAAA